MNLLGGRSFSDDDVASLGTHSHPVGVDQGSVGLLAVSDLPEELSLVVEDLDAVVVGVGHQELARLVGTDATRLSELTRPCAVLAKLEKVVDLLATQPSVLGVQLGTAERVTIATTACLCHLRVDGWVGGWLGGWKVGWVDGWVGGRLGGWMVGWVEGCDG